MGHLPLNLAPLFPDELGLSTLAERLPFSIMVGLYKPQKVKGFKGYLLSY